MASKPVPLPVRGRNGPDAGGDPHRRVRLFTSASLCCHFLYAVYHGALGISEASPWFLAICAFYSILTGMGFGVMMFGLWVKKRGSRAPAGLVRKAAGALLILLSAVLGWINYISLSQNIAAAYDTIPMITIAAYTFGRVTAAVVKALRRGPGGLPLADVLRSIGYAEVAASVLTLQRSMLVSFGRMEAGKMCVMNALTGAAVCLFVLSLGILAAAGKRKEDRSWQNQTL